MCVFAGVLCEWGGREKESESETVCVCVWEEGEVGVSNPVPL